MTGTGRAAHHAAGQPAVDGSRRWWALVLLCLAQFMVILDVTVVNVALPRIAHDLELDRATLTWVVTAYTLCFGGLMLLGGRLADAVGRRRTFLTGLAVFTLASLGSGLAANGEMLVAARAAQGVGAALLSPAALSILTTTFSGAERTRALGVWAALGGAGAAVGVLLGGLFTQGPGWEWVFFLNVPVGLLVAAALPRVVAADAGAQRAQRVDLPGAAIATSAIALLIYGLVRVGDAGWTDGRTLLALAGALTLLAAFVPVERRTEVPLIRPALLTRRPVLAGNLVMLAAAGLLLSHFFLSSQYLQRTLELGPLATGLLFLPVALVIGLGTHLGVRVVGRLGGRPAAVAGFLLVAGGALLLTRLPGEGSAVVFLLPGLALSGLGLGAALVAATTTAMAHVEERDAGSASGLINTGHELGASLGIALVSSIAAASLAGPGAGGVGGFRAAFAALAVTAVAAAALAGWLVPAGRAPAADRPVSVH